MKKKDLSPSLQRILESCEAFTFLDPTRRRVIALREVYDLLEIEKENRMYPYSKI